MYQLDLGTAFFDLRRSFTLMLRPEDHSAEYSDEHDNEYDEK